MPKEQSWLHHAFGFSGRANRSKFWLIPLVPLLALVALAVLILSVTDGPIGSLGAGLLALGGVMTIWVGLAVTVRRLHDRNKSGHWAWLYLGVPALLAGLSDNAAGLIGLVIMVWYLVDCGFLRGTRGPNRYGPDPLGTAD